MLKKYCLLYQELYLAIENKLKVRGRKFKVVVHLLNDNLRNIISLSIQKFIHLSNSPDFKMCFAYDT